MRAVTGALWKIVHGILVCASMDHFQLIPDKVDATVTGPPCEIGPMKGTSDSGRVTESPLRFGGCDDSASANFINGDACAFEQAVALAAC